MLYQICNGAVRFAAETVLENINFEIRNKEKIAVVGRNGCGKTTLLKLIAGEVELSKRDSDEDIYIAMAGKPVIGYLRQTAFEDDTLTLEQEVRKAFANLLQMKAEMERLVELMERENEESVISRYVRLEEQFAFLGGYSFEKEYCRLSELMSKEPKQSGNRRTMVGNGGNARNYKGIPDFIRTELKRY